ncbi:DUF2442 domain-containing protein [Lacihabitans sp. CCS-44]|uniref:DUF2442 domain-containing protein n=1 Tax=Lacihabitans sp. CCS-44 TaxID=2487331 RepID=UPI0020CB80A4|nr:DUF2442 domain-containing protein [Lacihabitans sp. CCS-44]MCP9757435.1 DUF2442 domain-containing protein [Lacihabitans sp. CCS-44]
MFPAPILVRSLGKYRIWLNYSDQIEGEVDLSYLAGKGVFKIWEIGNTFDEVFIDSVSKAIAWNEDIDLCPDSLYLQLKGITFDDWKKTENAYASN